MKKGLKITGIVLGALLGVLFVFVLYMYFGSYVPEDIENETVHCKKNAPVLPAGKAVKVMSWNIQYMAGKGYVFWYDMPNGDGPDSIVAMKDIEHTLNEIVRVVKAENPDILMIQEFHDNSKLTHYVDELKLFLNKMPNYFACHTQAFYWKAAFIPLPQIMGSAGMKLGTFSKYKISKAVRYALPPIPADPLTMRLGFHRAILAAHVPVSGLEPGTKIKPEVVFMNTHMDAFAQGTDAMEKQVAVVHKILTNYKKQNYPWLIGGDFNLIPPGVSRNTLIPEVRHYFNEKTEIKPLFDDFQSAATLKDLTGPNRAKFWTHNSNNPHTPSYPDRTIDYIFYSRLLNLHSYHVRQRDTNKISDHMPYTAVVSIKK